jgi:hypothetical protein
MSGSNLSPSDRASRNSSASKVSSSSGTTAKFNCVIQEDLGSSVQVRSSGVGNTIRSVGKMFAHELAVLETEEEEEPNLDNFRFKCPAQTCNGLFGADVPYSVFVSHVSGHAYELYEMGLHRCYFGCPEGFVDEIQLRRHVKGCRSYASLTMTSKGETQCSAPDCSFTGKDHARHWSHTHATDTYLDASTPYRDDVCQLGWTDPHLF